ncbi:MAG: SAM-dependent methyltransferase [Burkholderiales bacterium]|nr:SAM-dependent methyltransferase [Burkholderiales bacterium]
MMAGVLYAIPTPLGASPEASLPAAVLRTVRALRDFAVEDAKSARAFLAAVGCDPKQARIRELGDESDDAALLAPLREGRDLGLLSEAGCPGLADPGARLVAAAHRAGFRVVPLVGPSAIVLALMASGLEGQRFAFRGYLPRGCADRARRIRDLEARSRRERETQIFIETPYRSDALLAALLATCAPKTRLCVATDLTLPTESVRTHAIAAWRRAPPAIGKRPTVFLLLA